MVTKQQKACRRGPGSDGKQGDRKELGGPSL